MKIKSIKALEILDSRGVPTLQVEVEGVLGKKVVVGKSRVPSGKSTGSYEAVELRDNDAKRYGGKGLKKAVDLVNKVLCKKFKGISVRNVAGIDEYLLEFDSSPNKFKIGGNVSLGISVATAKAFTDIYNIPLYKAIRAFFDTRLKPFFRMNDKYFIPTPLFNVYNGGAHSDNNISIQEFLIIPKGIRKYSNQLRAAAEIYQILKSHLRTHGFHTGIGDEGGFSANQETDQAVLEILEKSVNASGYKWGNEIYIGLDVAISQFFGGGECSYFIPNWRKGGFCGDFKDLTREYLRWISRWPIILIEDPFSEDDWGGWSQFLNILKEKKLNVLLVGDDLIATNYKRLLKAINLEAINAIIVKPNQVGTLTETFNTCVLAKENGIKIIASHRSGDTDDTFIVDLAVGVGAEYYKGGAPVRGERTVKYNRLLEIEREIS